MTRLTKALASVLLLLGSWLALVCELVPMRLPAEIREVVVPLPLYALVVFGCYSLFVIGYRLSTFNDCTEAARSLRKFVPLYLYHWMQEIEEAKADLGARGVDVS